jgi:hypothetical protein
MTKKSVWAVLRRRYFLSGIVVLAVACTGLALATHYIDPLSDNRFDTQVASVRVPVETVRGVVQKDFTMEGGRMLVVGTDEGNTRPIILNSYTSCQWPDGWVSVSFDPKIDSPYAAPYQLHGRRIEAHVKTVRLGLFDKGSFALDISSQG